MFLNNTFKFYYFNRVFTLQFTFKISVLHTHKNILNNFISRIILLRANLAEIFGYIKNSLLDTFLKIFQYSYINMHNSITKTTAEILSEWMELDRNYPAQIYNFHPPTFNKGMLPCSPTNVILQFQFYHAISILLNFLKTFNNVQ